MTLDAGAFNPGSVTVKKPNFHFYIRIWESMWFGSMILMQVWEEIRQNKSVGLYTWSLVNKKYVRA